MDKEEGRGETASQFCRRTSQLNGAARGCVSLSLRSEAKVKSLSLSLLLERGKQRVEREREVVRGMMEGEREGVWFATLETLVKYSRKRVRNFFRSFSFLPRCPRLGIPSSFTIQKLSRNIYLSFSIFIRKERESILYIYTHKGREKSKGRRYVIPPRPQHVRPSPIGGGGGKKKGYA